MYKDTVPQKALAKAMKFDAEKMRSISSKKQVGDIYKLSKFDQNRHMEVNLDVDDMIKYAQHARKQGKDAIQGYMAIANLTKPGRSNIFPPVIHAMIYSRMSMEAANIPNVQYKHRLGASEPKMRWINAARKNAEAGDNNMRPPSVHLWMNQNFDKILFGVGFRYLSYLLQQRIVKITVDGKIKEKTTTVYDDIWDENLDFFNVGVSRDMLPGMFQGRACYFDKFFQRDVFLEKFDNENYINIGMVKNSKWYQANDFIRVRYYYDLYRDLYYMQACQKDPFVGGDQYGEYSLPIRDDFIQDYGCEDRPEKFLPVTSIHNDMNFDMKQESEFNILQAGRQYADIGNPTNNKSFWSKSDPYLVRALIGAKNILWRANIDNTKASTVNFLLAESTGIFDQVKSADLYGVVPIRAANNKSFDTKSLMANSDFMKSWQGADEMIDNAMTYCLGNDYKRVAADLTDEKATIAAVRNNVQQMRMKYNAKFNESGPIPRHYRILLNLIQQYYPERTLVLLSGDPLPPGITDEEDMYRDLDGQIIGYYKTKMIPYEEQLHIFDADEDGNQRIVSANHPDAVGKDTQAQFPATKNLLVTEEVPEIYIEPGSTFQEMKALEKSLEMEKVNAYMPFLGLSYPDGDNKDQAGAPVMKPLIGKEGAKYIIENMAEVFEDEPDKIFPDESDISQQPDPLVPYAFAGGQSPPTGQTPMGAMPGQPGQGAMPQQALPNGKATPPPAPTTGTPMAQAAKLRSALTP